MCITNSSKIHSNDATVLKKTPSPHKTIKTNKQTENKHFTFALSLSAQAMGSKGQFYYFGGGGGGAGGSKVYFFDNFTIKIYINLMYIFSGRGGGGASSMLDM